MWPLLGIIALLWLWSRVRSRNAPRCIAGHVLQGGAICGRCMKFRELNHDIRI